MNDGGVIPRFDGEYFFASVQHRPSQRLTASLPRPLRRSDSDPTLVVTTTPHTPYDNDRDVIDDCIAEMLDCANELSNIAGMTTRRPQFLGGLHHRRRESQQHPTTSAGVSTPSSSSIAATTPVGSATINDSLLSDNSSFFGDAEMSSASSEASYGSGGAKEGMSSSWKRDPLRSSEERESPYSSRFSPSNRRLIVNDDGYYTHISASAMSTMSSVSPSVRSREMERPQFAGAADLSPPVKTVKMRQNTSRGVLLNLLTDTHPLDSNNNNDVHDIDTLPAEWIAGLRQGALRKLQMMGTTASANGSGEPESQSRKNAIMKNVQKFIRHVRKQANSSSSSTSVVQKKPLLLMPRADDSDEIEFIFGTSLEAIQEATCGRQILPTCILEIIQFLETVGIECEGVFRRNGTDAGKRALLNKCEHMPVSAPVFVGENELTLAQTHDACALLKQYLRELPERLLTESVCEHMFRIPTDIKGDALVETIKYCIWLLPEQNLDALRLILQMLHTIANNSAVNFMTAKNLAVCMTPSLFVLSTNRIATNNTSSSKRRRTVGGSGLPSCRELAEYDVAQKILTIMIEEGTELFRVNLDKRIIIA